MSDASDKRDIRDLRDARDRLEKARPNKRFKRATKLWRRLKQEYTTRIDRTRARRRKRRTGDRPKPEIVLTRISPNQSERAYSPNLIVLHSTESDNIPNSDSDLAGIANYFANPSSDVSAHVITDGDGHSARCVSDDRKAWTQGAFNSAALSIEQIGRAASEKWTDDGVRETARWIARWSDLHGIPIRKGSVSGTTVMKSGVVTHKDLGAAGGGHVDPGANFPFSQCMKYAKEYLKEIQ